MVGKGKLALVMVSTAMLAAIVTSACGGGAAPTAVPTSKPAAPVATAAPAPTAVPAAATAAPTIAAATKAAPSVAPTAAAPAASGDVTAGKTVFDQNCNGCHPGGDRGVGPALKGRNLSADVIKTTVRSGKGGMPAFPAAQVSDQQLNNVVAYVQSLK